jgi:hypothetical protein
MINISKFHIKNSIKNFAAVDGLTLIQAAGGVYDFRNFEQV